MRIIVVSSCFLFFSIGTAQQFKATYSSKVNMKIDFSTNPNMPKDVADRIKKRMSEPTTYTLFFNQTQSIYKRTEKLEAPQAGDRGGMAMRFRGGDQNIVHTNLATRKQTNQQDLFGKLFLVEKEVSNPQWNFTGESKQIGKYTAYQATYSTMQEPPQFRMFFGRQAKNDEEQKKIEKVKVTVSVWFTPDIPIPAGPDRYFGLPGLVLMAQDNNRVLVCTEVQMNPKDKIELLPPKKGKKVSGKEFKSIREEKTKEIRERMRNNSNRNNQNRMFIRG